jgi:hypothetical protein
MIPDHEEDPYTRAVAVAMLIAISGVALRGHVPSGAHNPFAGAIGLWAALTIAAVILPIAVFVVARPVVARISARQQEAASHPRPAAAANMRSLVVIGICLALLAEFVAVCLPDRGDAHALTGVTVGLVLLGMCSYLGVVTDPPASATDPDDAGESLQRWVSRTESLIHWSETSRSDWDRRVRPILARQFEMATKANQRRTTDPTAFQATGKMLFGAELWQWVDPDNIVRGGVVRGGVRRRGPGRQTLVDILQCLEQV